MSKEILTLNSQTVIGMVHCLPLPTTAGFDGDYQRIIDRAVQDAVTLEKAGVDAVIVENMGDTPFSAFLNKAQVAALTAAAYAVKQAVQIPVGLDAAFNDCEADIAIAAMVGASFIRVPVFVDTVLFTDGIIQPCAKKCMEYRSDFDQCGDIYDCVCCYIYGSSSGTPQGRFSGCIVCRSESIRQFYLSREELK